MYCHRLAPRHPEQGTRQGRGKQPVVAGKERQQGREKQQPERVNRRVTLNPWQQDVHAILHHLRQP